MKSIALTLVLLISFTLSACQNPTSLGKGLPVETAIEQLPETAHEVSSLIVGEGLTLEERFLPPENAERVVLEEGSFGDYLRNLPLKPFGEKVSYFDGREKSDRAYLSVVDQDITPRNLEQCADAIMRLKGEYHYALGEYGKIAFHFVNGFLCDFETWSKGYTVTIVGDKATWTRKASNDTSYASFRKYMDLVHAFASTLSLEKELEEVHVLDMQVGDVFIEGGSPGHAVILVDMAEDSTTGKRYFILAQSYMPAQETQILRNLNDPAISPWYELQEGILLTPEWTFDEGTSGRFP